jgi:site-specific recombinase XerD
MATFYFQLERSKTLKDKTHPIYFVFKIKEDGKEKRFRYYTGRSATDKLWIGEGENKRVSSKAPGASITNTRLENIRQGADWIVTNAKNLKHTLTLEYFKNRFLQEVIGKAPAHANEGSSLTFFEHLQDHMDSQKGIFQPGTTKVYKSLKNALIDFESKIGYKITFESMNHIFITLFTKYLIEEKNLINSTLAKRVATLKAFLYQMERKKINRYTDYKDFRAPKDHETTLMYLSEAELMAIYNLELEPDTTLSHVRDAFCFACYTGLRFSDWANVKPENIVTLKDSGAKDIKALKITMHKIHREVIIPLNDVALNILDRYPNREKGKSILPVFTNQETNRTLKDLAKLAKLKEVIQDVKKSGANRITHTNHKHEVLSCHDARNTFATLYLEKGGRPEVLQRLLGHSNIKQTMRYVKIVEKTVISDYFKTMNTETAVVLPMRKPA